ncbi:MAG: type VI secretion protein [Rhodobacteraceae bacterium]|nr:type VI secretion protein [Paracoccaceae bacterium]
MLLAALMVAPIVALADVSECLPIENDLDRLSCYDREAGRNPVVTEIPTTSDWEIDTRKSEFKDTTDVFMYLQSDEPLNCGIMRSDQKITLVLRCVENTTAIYLSTHCHLASGHGGYGNVEYRVDDRPAGKRGFDDSTNSKALGLWRGNTAIPFIKMLFGGEKLLVRFTPFSENAVTASFNISGIEAALEPLRKACNW